MNSSMNHPTSRREFLKSTGKFAAASALAGVALPHVHAAEDNTVQFALVGCGGRGSGAAGNAFQTSKLGPIRLVAMADVFENRLNSSHKGLSKSYSSQMDVPPERRFIGFDAYQKAMDCLKPGDVAILGTPPAFRWVQFTYAIQKGLNVFMEKPVAVDGPTCRRMFKLGEEAAQKNLKVGVGLMIRHCKGRQELWQRIRDGQIGEIVSMRAYRMSGASALARPNPGQVSELLYQIQRFHAFLWASGGCYSDYYIHQIDECSWMKNAWPVKAHALGGRHFRGDSVDQNLDSYSVEYTYPDGTKLHYNGRNMSGCKPEFASYVHGSKGSAIISTNSHSPGRVRIFKNQDPNPRDFTSENVAWAFSRPPEREPSPYDLEWDHLMDAIRNNRPYNEVKRGVEASLVTCMGRMAAHTGQEVTYDEMLNCEHEFAPGLDKLTKDSPAPLLADANGRYPVPEPGIKRKREY
ncbi:MAG: Gfo/Idh/MocA family oxidoreductase [Verrucomicrobia bacterium]|nr:Gfo/Idh/MocA family oxidoreductase [Verrucomicrobiota bacterium]